MYRRGQLVPTSLDLYLALEYCDQVTTGDTWMTPALGGVWRLANCQTAYRLRTARSCIALTAMPVSGVLLRAGWFMLFTPLPFIMSNPPG